MKGASSASGAAAATAASQVQPVVGLHGRIHDLFSPITAASCADKEEYEKLAETKTRTDKIEVLPKGYSNDDTKAKSTAMSRLLAVDSDNYMLRKGATSANGAVASTSTVPAIVPAASISNASSIAQNLQLHPRQIPPPRNFHTKLGFNSNGTYSDLETSIAITAKTCTSSIKTMPVNDPPPPSEPLNSKGSAALLLPKRHTSVNQQQIHPVNNAASSSSSFCSVTSLTSTKFLNLPISRKQQFSKLSLIADQFRSNPTSKSASKELLENAEEFSHLWPSGLFPCARTVSFHQYLCSCNDFSQQNSESSMNGNAYDVMAEESVYSNSIGHEGFGGDSGQRALDKGTGAGREPATMRNLCCCMCGSLCPPECHACFHVVCSEYSGQHLCQWSSKGHALPGQVLDKDKVSKIIRFFILNYSFAIIIILTPFFFFLSLLHVFFSCQHAMDINTDKLIEESLLLSWNTH